jgi:hypothetical protein
MSDWDQSDWDQSDWDQEEVYRIGYRRPPRHSRFRKGRSGNPRGRPKGSRNLGTILWQALLERIEIHKGSRRRKITKYQAAIEQLVNRAAAGDLRAVRLLLGGDLGLQEATGEFAPKRGLSGELVQEMTRQLCGDVAPPKPNHGCKVTGAIGEAGNTTNSQKGKQG